MAIFMSVREEFEQSLDKGEEVVSGIPASVTACQAEVLRTDESRSAYERWYW